MLYSRSQVGMDAGLYFTLVSQQSLAISIFNIFIIMYFLDDTFFIILCLLLLLKLQQFAICLYVTLTMWIITDCVIGTRLVILMRTVVMLTCYRYNHVLLSITLNGDIL